MGGNERVGVLLANTGTPSAPTPKAVRAYLKEFLSNPRIVPMNRFAWALLLHAVILPTRSRTSAEKYASVWTDEGSPLIVEQERLAAGLSRRYADDDADVQVVCGMSFGDPSLAAALARLRDAGCARVVCLPLYPQSAYATTSVVRDGLEAARRRLEWDAPCAVVDRYGDNCAYVRAVADSVRREGIDPASEDRLVFSFHSIPVADIEAGDSYERQVSESCLAIAEELGLGQDRWVASYQSRFDKGRAWLAPTTKDVIARMADEGVRRLFVACPGFAIDCLETLRDIDVVQRSLFCERARAADGADQGRSFHYVPCLGGTEAHVDVLRDVLAPYVKGRSR